MIYQRLAGLFGRYAAAHLVASGRPAPLLGETGQTLGHIDRISVAGPRVVIEGWVDAVQITLAHAGAQQAQWQTCRARM